MNITVFSTNTEITQHLVDEFSETEHEVKNFSTLEELKSTLKEEETTNLIYHLGLRKKDEVDFSLMQTHFKHILNTLVLTNTPHPEQGVRLLNLNVRGYANTYIEQDKLIMAMSVISQGEIWAGASLIRHLLTNITLPKSPEETLENEGGLFNQLTRREQEIAQKILTGLQNKLIADELDITERTVKAHLSTIFKKLEVRNRLELIVKLQNANR